MKKPLFILSSVFAMLAFCLPATAQDGSVELQAFQQAASYRSILFRGMQASRYTFLANGHPYWIQPEFMRGDITFEGNLYRDVPINIDAHAQRALVQLSHSAYAVALSPALTSSFTMGGRRFVGIGAGQELPEGFYEVFGDGPEQVYKHVDKRLNTSVTNVNGQTIGYYDENYRTDVMRHFSYVKTYYFRDAQGHFTRFKSKGALLRQFGDRKKAIRHALRDSRMDLPSTDFDAYCKAVLNIAAR